jgi:hypothetical protein
VGKRHRRIRARSTTGSVAGAASEYSGLSAHQPWHGLPSLRSPRSPCPDRPTLSSRPDSRPPRAFHALKTDPPPPIENRPPSGVAGASGGVLSLARSAVVEVRRKGWSVWSTAKLVASTSSAGCRSRSSRGGRGCRATRSGRRCARRGRRGIARVGWVEARSVQGRDPSTARAGRDADRAADP